MTSQADAHHLHCCLFMG